MESSYIVFLTILGDELNPDELTQLFDIEPDEAWSAGDNKALYGLPQKTYKWGGWRKSVSPQFLDEELEPQVDHWCQFLRQHQTEIKKMQKDGIAFSLDCLIESEETAFIQFDPKLTRELSELKLCIDLTFNPLPPTEEPCENH